jgi:hypothetical protein
MGETYSIHNRKEKCLKNFGWKLEGKKPLVRPRHRYEYLRETG